MGDYWAHSENEKGKPHLLEDHLGKTAELCQSFTASWGYPEIGYLLGIMHDMGKYSDEFQDYLKNNGKRTDHSSLGMMRALEVMDILGLIVSAHHSGLPDIAKFKNRVNRARNKEGKSGEFKGAFRKLKGNSKENFLGNFQEKIQEKISGLKANLPDFKGEEEALKTEFFIRMCFSALVDADYLDTESHFSPGKHEERSRADRSLSDLFKRFEEDQEALISGADKNFVNKLREKIYREAMAKTAERPGFFSLTVPTGGGKTRINLGFSLKHAEIHNLDRIIVVIPYTNIIEQTAEEYRSILGTDQVLEHHASVGAGNENQAVRLAAENWDIPLVVTTSVQFFESIYASRPGSLRKIHNIANSVVIFDEVQTLPPGLLQSILWALKELKENYGVSFIFSTATQPAFAKDEEKFSAERRQRRERNSGSEPGPGGDIKSGGNIDSGGNFKSGGGYKSGYEGYKPGEEFSSKGGLKPGSAGDLPVLGDIRELAPEPESLFAKLKRVSFKTDLVESRADIEDIIDKIGEYNQALLVVNTRKQAKEHYQELLRRKEYQADNLFHLSNNMTPLHRSRVFKDIKGRLKDKQKCYLVSTQLIEAGVDLDFPVVLRATAPLDSLVQAAGRCNREGKLERGEAIIFTPEEDVLPPGIYKTATEKTRRLLRRDVDFHDPGLFKKYFSSLYRDIDLDKENIQNYRRKWQFSRVAKNFRLIPDKTVNIIVENYQGHSKAELDELEKIMSSLKKKGFISREEWRRLQLFTVSIYEHSKRKLVKKGLISEILEEVYLWGGKYDEKTGLVSEVSYTAGDLLN